MIRKRISQRKLSLLEAINYAINRIFKAYKININDLLIV
jgi:hypothetical protein